MRAVESLMGTNVAITVLDDRYSADEVDRAFSWLRWVEDTFSVFEPGSEISRIGKGQLDIGDASDAVQHVLETCEELVRTTGSRFSIRPGDPSLPPLDPSGYVKGWSVDRAARRMSDAGVERFSIDAGGDVMCVGTGPSGQLWKVGLRTPDQPELVGAVLRIPGGAVATSGTYFRGPHIWGSGIDVPTIASATVVGPSLGVADALATAIFADQAQTLGWMSAFPDYGVALVTCDGMIRWSSRLDGVIVTDRDDRIEEALDPRTSRTIHESHSHRLRF